MRCYKNTKAYNGLQVCLYEIELLAKAHLS